jgi:hypothetical protein
MVSVLYIGADEVAGVSGLCGDDNDGNMRLISFGI